MQSLLSSWASSSPLHNAVKFNQVASGDVDLAVGSDQGGSVRLPAAWCGVVGLKPTFGLVPYTGAVVVEPSVDHLGPLTKTVNDCALFLEVSIHQRVIVSLHLVEPYKVRH